MIVFQNVSTWLNDLFFHLYFSMTKQMRIRQAINFDRMTSVLREKLGHFWLLLFSKVNNICLLLVNDNKIADHIFIQCNPWINTKSSVIKILCLILIKYKPASVCLHTLRTLSNYLNLQPYAQQNNRLVNVYFLQCKFRIQNNFIFTKAWVNFHCQYHFNATL